MSALESPKKSPEKKNSGPEKRFFTVLPGEVPGAPEGGDFILDAKADPTADGVFEYKGHRLRRASADEYAEINRITADAKLRREKGPRRLSALDAGAAPAAAAVAVEPIAAAEPEPEIVAPKEPERAFTAHEGAGYHLKKKVFEGFDENKMREIVTSANETLNMDNLGKRADERVGKKKEDAELDLAKFQLIANHEQWKGGSNQAEPHYYIHPDRPGEVFTPEQVDQMRRLRHEPPEPPQPPEPPKGPDGAGHVPPGAPEGFVREKTETVSLEEFYRTDTLRFRGVKPKSLDLILADKVSQMEFGALVQRLDGEAGEGGLKLGDSAMEKMGSKQELTKLEERFLNYARHEYERLRIKTEYVRAQMVAEDLNVVARFDQGFQATMGLRGTERTMEFFKAHLGLMAMKNPETIERLQGIYERLAKVRESSEYKAWAGEIDHLHGETKTNVDDFGVVFNPKNKDEQLKIEQELTAKYRAQKGGVGRFFDSIFNTSRTQARNVITSARHAYERSAPGKYQDAVRQYGDEMRELAGLLKKGTTNEAEASFTLQQEALQNKNLVLEAETGPESYAQLTAEETPSVNRINTDLDARVRDFRHEGKDWDHTPIEARRAAAVGWEREFHGTPEIMRYRAGWFARTLRALKRLAFGKKMDTLINKPVAA